MSEEIAVISITLSGGSARVLDELAVELELLARRLATKRGLRIAVTQDQEVIPDGK